jgi:bis(5'-nucleosyl)-tetraphosphatase (symmetrical)
MGDVLVAPDREELLAWIRTLPLMHHDAGLGFALIHAGLPPQWYLAQAQACAREVETVLRSPDFPELFKHMYGNEPHRWADDLSGWERLRFIINCFTRLRYCDSEGYVALHEKSLPGQQPAPLLPWYAVPGRRSRGLRIIFGHWSTLGRYAGDNVYCLDTGCVWGGRLTALRLDDMRWFGVACAGACEPGEE